MQRGDIQLFNVVKSSTLIDKAIGTAQWLMGYRGGEYCHVEVIAGSGISYGARWPFTGLYPTDTKRPYEIYRINGAKIEDIERGIAYLNCNIGEWYDIPALITAGWIRSKHEQVCSTYAGNYIEVVKGCDFPHKKFIKPDDIKSMTCMTLIERGG